MPAKERQNFFHIYLHIFLGLYNFFCIYFFRVSKLPLEVFVPLPDKCSIISTSQRVQFKTIMNAYEETFYVDFQTLWKGRSWVNFEAMSKQFVVPPTEERQVSTPWTAKRCVEVLQKPFWYFVVQVYFCGTLLALLKNSFQNLLPWPGLSIL